MCWSRNFEESHRNPVVTGLHVRACVEFAYTLGCKYVYNDLRVENCSAIILNRNMLYNWLNRIDWMLFILSTVGNYRSIKPSIYSSLVGANGNETIAAYLKNIEQHCFTVSKVLRKVILNIEYWLGLKHHGDWHNLKNTDNKPAYR